MQLMDFKAKDPWSIEPFFGQRPCLRGQQAGSRPDLLPKKFGGHVVKIVSLLTHPQASWTNRCLMKRGAVFWQKWGLVGKHIYLGRCLAKMGKSQTRGNV